MLSIKPVMHTDNEGRLTMVGKARGRKASLKALLDAIERLAIEPEKQTMFICHADCEEEAKQVAADDPAPLRHHGYPHPLHRAGHRQPHRPQHHGPVLRGNGAVRHEVAGIEAGHLPGGAGRAATQLLEEQGITGLVIDDEEDFQDFLEHNHQYWDYVDEDLMAGDEQGLCRITFYLSDGRRRAITGWRRCGWPCRS